MTTPQRFERDLPVLLEDLYLAGTPDYRDDLVQRIAATRQRPAWTFPERWLPMDIATTRAATARFPWRAVGVLALIGLLLAAVLTAYVGSQTQLPAPFGVAANGLVAYVDDNGAIRAADPLSGQSDVIVPGPGNERPLFSPDGARLAFLKRTSSGTFDVLVAGVDGREPSVITPEPLMTVAYLGWSPDAASVVVSVPPGRVLVYDAAVSADPRTMSVEGLDLGARLDEYNSDIRDLFRPPLGDEILVVASTPSGPTLSVANADGTDVRTIIDPATAGPTIASLEDAQWSPDGTRIAVSISSVGVGEDRKLWVVNADGTGLRMVTSGPETRDEGHLQWSPDGTRIAFMRWRDWVDGSDGVDVRPITVVDVETGAEIELGDVSNDGFHGWTWSPDGLSILQIPSNRGHAIVLPIDPTARREDLRTWTSEGWISWQRLAPAR